MSNWKTATSDFWKPEAGQSLEGVFAGTRETTGKYGKQQQATIRLDGGGAKVVGMTAALVDAFAGIPIGSRVKVTFQGKYRTKNGNQANKYEVLYDDTAAVGAPTPAASGNVSAPAPSGIDALEAQLRQKRGDQVAQIQLNALQVKFAGDPKGYEAALQALVAM